MESHPPLAPALCPDLGIDARADAMYDVGYWRSLCPQLHVADADFTRRATAAGPFDFRNDPETVRGVRATMARDGYAVMPAEGGALPWTVDLGAMAAGVAALVAHGWPPSFLMLYDEPWAMAHSLGELLELTTGNVPIGDWSVFYVDPAREGGAAGWPPHRDRGNDGTAAAFNADGTAQYNTVWLALTDATPSNSCLSVVPRADDPGYSPPGDGGGSPLGRIFDGRPEAFQLIRALPCAAGSLVTFTHRLLHWGSRADPHSREPPRVAVSFAASTPAFEPPYFRDNADAAFPPLPLRVALVCGNLLMYSQNEDPGPDLAALYWHCFVREQRGGGGGGGAKGQRRQPFTDKYAAQVAACRAFLLDTHGVAGGGGGRREAAPAAAAAPAPTAAGGAVAGPRPPGPLPDEEASVAAVLRGVAGLAPDVVPLLDEAALIMSLRAFRVPGRACCREMVGDALGGGREAEAALVVEVAFGPDGSARVEYAMPPAAVAKADEAVEGDAAQICSMFDNLTTSSEDDDDR